MHPTTDLQLKEAKAISSMSPRLAISPLSAHPWTNQTADTAAAPAISVKTPQAQEAWAFVVSGHLEGKPAFEGYQVMVRNLRTDSTITASVHGDYFAAATADLSRRSVVQVGDVVEVRVIGPEGNVESDTFNYKVTLESIADAVLPIRLDSVGKPKLTQLLQNFPNPFNPGDVDSVSTLGSQSGVALHL